MQAIRIPCIWPFFPLFICTLTPRIFKAAENGGAAHPASVARTGSFLVRVVCGVNSQPARLIPWRSGASEITVCPPFFLHHVNYPFTICLQRFERRSWSCICLIR